MTKNFWILSLALSLMFNAASRAADKVMPLGDSLTYGAYGAGLDGNGGYRAPLWNHLVTGGYNVDFVGSVTGPGPNTIDLNHEGRPGWRNDDLSNNVDGWMSTYQPGVIMLLAGANDIIQGASTATAIARLNVLLDKIIADRPNSPLIVSNLIYVRTPNDYNYSLASIQAYNAQIPGLVSARAAQGKKIYFLDMYAQTAMVDSDLSADGIHPNDSGYAKMANVWYTALTPFLSRTSSDLRVNANGHYLEKSDGTPFFFLSDTEWLLNSHSDAQITQLLDDRKARGFTVVQVFATRNWNNGSDPACKDANGNLPFINNDPTQFNIAYWDRWRWIVDRAAERGLHFLLIYGEPGRLENPWKCSTNAQCYAYGHRVGDYFKDKSNMIFCNGQDSDANGGVGANGWRAMAEGVADGVNGENNFNNSADYSTTLMTYHGYSIYQTFQNDAWIDFYGQEVWHNNSQVYGTVNTGYNLTNPTKPIALLEGTYELEDGIIFPGQTTPYYVRVEAYNTFFSGGFGYGFGNSQNWQQFANINYLSSPANQQMGVLANFFKGREWWKLVPDQGVIASGENSGANRKIALKSADGLQCCVYFPINEAGGIRMDRISSSNVNATWLDPRSGATQTLGSFARTAVPTIQPPSGWEDALLILTPGSTTPPPPPPPDGLVVYLKLDDGSGTVATDTSGNGNNGALVNGPPWTTGKVGGGLALDGQNDYINVSNSTSLNLLKGQMTVALWVYKRADVPGYAMIAGRRFGPGYGDLWNLFYDNSGTDDYLFHVLGSTDVSIRGPSSAGDVNQWVHLAGVYDGATLRLYRNGVQVASGALSGTIPDESSPLLIGAGDNGTNGIGEFINAIVDDFHLYNRALSASEISALMAGTPPPPPPGGGSGTILREVWTGVSGTAVANIPLSSTPDQIDQPTSFEAPTNWADNYGTRMRGYVYPPVSGSYSFWIAGDDNSELWLSSDANPATKVRIASGPDWTNSREWTKFPSQHSAAVTLVAGQKYYIEALQKEGSGGDNLAVAWDGPGISQQVIAGQYLSPWVSVSTGSGTGLRGDYFDNSDFSAQKISRVDATVNFDWGTGSPDASIGADTFSVRWTGQVQAQYSETYTFYTVSDDGVRLWVNGQQLINNWTDHAPTENSGTISLVAGQMYDIKLELYENGGGAVGKLFWSSASTAKDVVPTSQLYPANAAPPAFTLYRAINLNGVATTIDGNAWEGKTAPNYSFNGSSFENQSIVLSPATDANRATMIRSSIWNPAGSNVTVGAMPSGNYRVYLYVWEDNFSQTFSISLEGNVVQANYASGTGGHWDKLGPWDVAVTDGALNLTCSAGDANLSGIEIWQATSATSFAAKSVKLAASPSVGDSDGDGLLDTYEIAAGLDPNNPDSDGNGILDGDELVSGGDMTQSQAQQIWLAAQNANASMPFTITKLSGKLSPSKPGKDSVSAVLSFAETISLAKGSLVSFDIAGAKAVFTLDKNGRARRSAGAVMFVNSKKGAGTQAKVKLVNRTAAGYWLDAGIAFSKSKGSHSVHIDVNVNGAAYAAEANATYTIVASQSLSFKNQK